MKVPNFSNPSPDCYLKYDMNGEIIKEGDVLQSNMNSVRGYEKKLETYPPIKKRKDGALVIPWGGSFLLDSFVSGFCYIISSPPSK